MSALGTNFTIAYLVDQGSMHVANSLHISRSGESKLWNPRRRECEFARVACPPWSTEIGLVKFVPQGAGHPAQIGQPLHLYGLCTHAEFKDTGGTATAAGIQLVIDHAKALGCNFLRCAHYRTLRPGGGRWIAPGLLWWEECRPTGCPIMHTESQTRAPAHAAETHPSRIGTVPVSSFCRSPTSVAGAIREKPEENNYPYWFKAVAMVRKMDPSRLISCCRGRQHDLGQAGVGPGQRR